MKKLLLSFLCCMLAVIGMQAAETATLSFADKAQRTSYSTTEQVWEQNGITFTNNKNSSQTNVGDYANPVRLYANSKIVIEFGQNMTEIQFTCSTAAYATELKNSITVDATATVNGNTVTAVLTAPSTSFTIASLSAQVRLSSITVTYETAGEGGGEEPEQPGEGGGETPVEPTPDPEDPVEPTPEGETKTISVIFSEYKAGTQYAENEEHEIDNALTIYTTQCHFTTELRIYSSDTHNGYVVSNKLPGAITNMTFNAGNKADVLNVYGSTNGSEWTLVGAVNVTSTSYNDYSLDFTGDYDYTYFKLDVAGTNQVRLKSMSVTYKAEEGVVLPPTFDPAGGIDFVESIDVTIAPANNESVYYSFDENGEYVEYTQPITITETTTVYAYAQNAEGKQSDVVSATYTRKEIVEGVWTKVTDATTLIEGAEVVIVAEESDYALSTTQKTNNRGQGEVIKDGDAVYFGEDVQILTIERGTVAGSWAFYATGVVDEDGLPQNNGYLYAASSSGNQLKTQATNNDNGSWNVTIADGVTSIVAQGSNSRKVLQYNNGLFSCYGSASQAPIALYRKYAEANITSGNCYNLAVGAAWEEPEGCWYAAKFINANTGEYTWSVASDRDDENIGYIFYLAPGNTPLGHEPQLDPDFKYTHVEFVQLPATVEEPADIRTLDLTGVEYTTTGVIWYDGVSSKTYSIAEKAWMAVGTGVNRVELADGIGYAYGVVSAEGAIEVYNVNGAVVARGNDNVDLRGLGRGVYIIRNGNQVRKVVR